MPPFFCAISTHSLLAPHKVPGRHEKAISMSMDDYLKAVKPKVLEFSYHVTS